MMRASDRLMDWVSSLPPTLRAELQVRSFELDPSRKRHAVALLDLTLGQEPHLLEIRLRRQTKKQGGAWKIWDLRCGSAGVHLTRQYTAQFRSLKRQGGLKKLVAIARSYVGRAPRESDLRGSLPATLPTQERGSLDGSLGPGRKAPGP